MTSPSTDRSYDLIRGEWVEIGDTVYGPARAMPIEGGIPEATQVVVRDGHPDADGPTTIQYTDAPKL